VHAAGEGRDWCIEVENDAPGLEASDLDDLERPFWRKGDGDEEVGHAGLGLALSRALSDRAGLELRFHLEPGGRLRARLSAGAAHAT